MVWAKLLSASIHRQKYYITLFSVSYVTIADQYSVYAHVGIAKAGKSSSIKKAHLNDKGL